MEPYARLAVGVELPPEPGDDISAAHEKTIAEMVLPSRIRRGSAPVHDGHDPLAAAVRDLEQQRPVRAPHFPGFQQEEVRGELDLTLRVPRSSVEVHHAPVLLRLRANREVDPADDLLEGPDLAEALAARHFDALPNFYPRHPRGSGKAGEDDD